MFLLLSWILNSLIISGSDDASREKNKQIPKYLINSSPSYHELNRKLRGNPITFWDCGGLKFNISYEDMKIRYRILQRI